MIRYSQGNLLAAPTEALVNTVNEVGVMGKGSALMFARRSRILRVSATEPQRED